MSRALDRLAAIAGIEPSFIDYWGRETIVSDETKRALLATMGFDAGDVRDLQPSPDTEPRAGGASPMLSAAGNGDGESLGAGDPTVRASFAA